MAGDRNEKIRVGSGNTATCHTEENRFLKSIFYTSDLELKPQRAIRQLALLVHYNASVHKNQ